MCEPKETNAQDFSERLALAREIVAKSGHNNDGDEVLASANSCAQQALVSKELANQNTSNFQTKNDKFDASCVSQDSSEAQKARFEALKYIGIDKGKSSGKVRQKLKKVGFDEEIIEAAIEGLVKDDYLSDYRACARITRRHQGSKLKSARYMEELYKQLGVAADVAADFAADLPTDQESLAILLAKEKYPFSEKEKVRIIRRLAGRGFSIYSIQKAMEDISE